MYLSPHCCFLLFIKQFDTNSGNTQFSTRHNEQNHWTLPSATVHMLKIALEDDENERFALMSDNSIPLRSFHTVYCTLLADPQSIINACVPEGKHRRDYLVRLPSNFPPWLNESVWRKSSQWWAGLCTYVLAPELQIKIVFLTLIKRLAVDIDALMDQYVNLDNLESV